MKTSNLVEGLAKIVGEDNVFTDEEIILENSKDYIGFRRYQRDDGKNFAPRGSCVVRPHNTEEVSKVLKFLNDNNVPTTPKTGGSSVTLSIEPVPGGVIVDGGAMNEIIEVSEEDMSVTARCGTPLEYLEEHVNELGYTTGHFPQSLPMAHVGGLVATRSTGQFSTLYGGIEELVVGLEAVLPDGEIVRIKNVPRRSSGPDLRHIFIGNEGVLGFITEVTLKLFKHRPEDRWMRAYGIKDMELGLEMVRDIMADGYKPAVVRLHDAAEVLMVLGLQAVVPEGEALLMFICEGPKSIADATGKAIEKCAEKYGATDIGDKPVQSWLKTRNDECYKLDNQGYYKMGMVADTCEIAANWSEIGNIYHAVVERLPEELEDLVYVGGHASHCYIQGTNIYFTFAFMEEDAEAAEGNYMDVVRIIMEETLKRGGSIAHHHGSGKYRTEWMPEEHGSSYLVMRRLKEILDPNNILNQGVLITDE